MEQDYPLKTFKSSFTNTEKTIGENIKNVVNGCEQKNSARFVYLKNNWDKLVYTACILVTYMNAGIVGGIFPPAMVDMKFLFHTTMDKISYVNLCANFGYIFGSLTGFSYKYINRQLSFIVGIILIGLFVAVEPICVNLWQLYTAIVINGFGGGVWDSGNTPWVTEMWGKNSAPVLQLSQMMYGCGSIIGPLLVSPFIYGDLSNKSEEITTSTVSSTLSTIIMNTTTPLININVTDDDINYSVDRRSKLIIPYSVGGGLMLTTPAVLLVMFFVKRYKIQEKQIPSTNDKIESKLTIIEKQLNEEPLEMSSSTRKLLIALVALSLNCYSGLELIFFGYSSTYYQYLPIHLSAPTAAHLMSVMTASYTVGRGVSAYISSKLKAEVMLTYHIIILLLSLTVLYTGQHSEKLIYVGNAMIGLGFSAMWPSYFAFSEKYIRLTDRVTSIFSFASGLFALCAPFILGPQIEKNPQIFLIIEMALMVPVIGLFFLMMVIVKRSQRYPVLYTINYK